MDKIICKICGKEFNKKQSLAAHISMVHSEKRKLQYAEKKKQNTHINICKECGKKFEAEYESKKFCSLSCAAKFNNRKRKESDYYEKLKIKNLNRHYNWKNRITKKVLNKNTDEYLNRVKENAFKIKFNFKNKPSKNALYYEDAVNYVDKLSEEDIKYFHEKFAKLNTCIICNKNFYTYTDRKTCSDECFKQTLVKGGLKSANKQKKTRRSKNEILMYEKCKNYFNTVLANENMFNGWDADIILPEYKIAILWNGAWHYREITNSTSLKQIQNRDKIKVKEIEQCGYYPYIIKDLGKFNKDKVDMEFEKLLNFLNSNFIKDN